MATVSTVTVSELLAHTDWARRLARRLTADADAADDLLQETWINATRQPPTTDRPLRPWLAVVLRNLFIKRTRSERRRAARHAQVVPAPAAQHLSPDALLEKVEVQRLLAELVASLDEPYRQAVILRYFEDLSSAEIARRLEIPAGTVRWRLKSGLDELRKRLDQRHGGRRDHWLAALLPLTSPRRPRAWPWLAAAATVVSVVAVPLVVRSRHSPPTVDASDSGRRAPGGVLSSSSGSTPPGPARMLSVSIPTDLSGCREEVGRLRMETATTAVERRLRLPFRELFGLGAANPEAAQAVAPAIERILRGARATAPSHSLECRTWACRISIAQTREEENRTNEWQLPLQRDPEMRERTTGISFRGGNPSKDPLSGIGLVHREVFFTLADPSGRRMPEPRQPPRPEVSLAPLPATAEQCAAEVKTLREQLQTVRDDIEAHRSPIEKFYTGSPDRRLTEQMRSNIVAKFPGPESAHLDLECRALVCRARWENAPTDWHNQLSDEPWFRKMTDGMFVGAEVYFVMAPRPRADGIGFLRDIVRRFDASNAPDVCAARFPATGTLEVKLHLPRTGERNENGELGRISAVYGDTLAGTPLGKCLEEAIASAVLPASLPELSVGGAVYYHRFKFPRPAEALMSRPR